MPIEVFYGAAGLPSLLSNLAHTPFTMEGNWCASIEGVLSGLHIKDRQAQREAFGKWGPTAKVYLPPPSDDPDEARWVYWMGRPMKPGGTAHKAIMRAAMRTKFEKSPFARHAMLASGEEQLLFVPSPPEEETSLPPDLFLELLRTCQKEAHGRLLSLLTRELVVFRGCLTGKLGEAEMWAHRRELAQRLFDEVFNYVLLPLPVTDLGKQSFLTCDLQRAIAGMIELSLGRGDSEIEMRSGLEARGKPFQKLIATDLAFTIAAELRAHDRQNVEQ